MVFFKTGVGGKDTIGKRWLPFLGKDLISNIFFLGRVNLIGLEVSVSIIARARVFVIGSHVSRSMMSRGRLGLGLTDAFGDIIGEMGRGFDVGTIQFVFVTGGLGNWLRWLGNEVCMGGGI